MIAEVLNMFRAGDISDIVKSLNHEQQDVLMKYIYAGLSKPELYNSSVLLTWHEKVIFIIMETLVIKSLYNS